jgi:hypothetical protein
MDRHCIKDHSGRMVAEFDGELIAESTSDDGERARWIELNLYRTESGWAVHRASRSTLYHRIDTPCRTPKQARPGVASTADHLLEDAVPCGACNPPEISQLAPGSAVRIEVDRHNVHFLDTDQQVVGDLTIDRRNATPYWSQPVVELLLAAGKKHPAFLAMMPTQGIVR